MTNNDLTILNNGSDTRYDIQRNKCLAIKCNWKVHDDLMGSDHFPIVTEIELKFQFNDYTHIPKWK